jgi:isoleucyl-tRNA synthetase
VSKALEQARIAKVIGHSLDAAVAIAAPAELLSFLREYTAELKSVFIVSKVELVEELSGECYTAEGVEGLTIRVTAAPGAKCERCWCYDEEIGKDSEHPTICPKCLKAVK